MKKVDKERMASKLAKEFFRENQELFNDYSDICKKILLFRVAWGINITIRIDEPEQQTARWSDIDNIKDLKITKKK